MLKNPISYYQCLSCHFIQHYLSNCINCGHSLMIHLFIIDDDGFFEIHQNNIKNVFPIHNISKKV